MLTPNVRTVKRSTNDYDRAVEHIIVLKAQLQRQTELSSELDKDVQSLRKRLKDLIDYVKGCEEHIQSQQIFIKSIRGGMK